MPISGVWGDLLGNDAFSKFGLKLWWERAHAVCNTLYIILIFAFGLFSTMERPACLQANENGTILEAAGPDAFISEFCLRKAPFSSNITLICCMVIYCSLGAEFVSINSVKKRLCHPLCLFSRAEVQYAELNLSLKDVKLLAVQPNLLETVSENYSVSQVRKIFCHLQKCAKSKFRVHSVFRESRITIILALSVAYTVRGVIIAISSNNLTFVCDIQETEIVFWNVSGTLYFKCINRWTLRKEIIVSIYLLILVYHCLSRIFGLCYVCKLCLRHCGTDNVFFIKTLWAYGRTVDNLQFGDFTEFLLSNKCLEAVKKNIALVGTCADIQFTEMAEALIDLENVRLKPDLQGLIDNKRWDWIVALLEKFPEPFDDFSPLKQVDVMALHSRDSLDSLDDGSGSSDSHSPPQSARQIRSDNYSPLPSAIHISSKNRVSVAAWCKIEGRSLLFYALNKEPGSATFHMRATKRILECTQGRERVVCYNGGRVSAKEFVELQHASDPTYPDRIKDKLLELISNAGKSRVSGLKKRNATM